MNNMNELILEIESMINNSVSYRHLNITYRLLQKFEDELNNESYTQLIFKLSNKENTLTNVY